MREAIERHRSKLDENAALYRTRYVRFGPSVANRAGDVQRGVEAVAAIARRT